jgi:hypothetical protein
MSQHIGSCHEEVLDEHCDTERVRCLELSAELVGRDFNDAETLSGPGEETGLAG